MQTVLVTGSTGFVGQAVLEKLLREVALVRGAVRSIELPVGLPEGVSVASVGSIDAGTDWYEALEGVDTVIHLAARVHVMREFSQEPLAAFRQVNVEGTKRLASMAAAQGVRRFVFVSSVKVLGEESVDPYTENDTPAPLDPYGVSKQEAEEALHEISAATGMEVVILRPPLVYGPGVKANFFRLLEMVNRGVLLPLGSIENRRSMIYVGNLTDAIITCATHPKAVGQTFLVSDGEDVSTPQLINRIANALGRPARLIPFPPFLLEVVARLLRMKNVMDRIAGSLAVDSSKIRQELGWSPPYTMAEGLAITAKWFKGRAR